jgi:Rrf2 family protein
MIPTWYHIDMIKLINKESDVGIRVLRQIYRTNKIVTVTGLAKLLNVPKPFLRKILQKLAKADILESTKGRNGGFIPSKDATKIFVGEVIEIFQGNLAWTNCIQKNRTCEEMKNCPLRKKLTGLEQIIRNELERMNIFNLL